MELHTPPSKNKQLPKKKKREKREVKKRGESRRKSQYFTKKGVNFQLNPPNLLLLVVKKTYSNTLKIPHSYFTLVNSIILSLSYRRNTPPLFFSLFFLKKGKLLYQKRASIQIRSHRVRSKHLEREDEGFLLHLYPHSSSSMDLKTSEVQGEAQGSDEDFWRLVKDKDLN